MISVVMACHNGARFIDEQIDSVLPQLSCEDELVIVDDASRDDTVERILGRTDSRVRLQHNRERQGVLKSFQRAIAMARGDFIFLCDQDDLWTLDKVSSIIDAFDSNPACMLVLSDARVIAEDGRELYASFQKQRGGFKFGAWANIVRNRFLGCTMAFRRTLVCDILPFPKKLPMHDMWIGIIATMRGEIVYIDAPLISYRRHGGNASPGRHAALGQMLIWRYHLICSLMQWKLGSLASRTCARE